MNTNVFQVRGRNLNVHYLPHAISEQELAGSTVIVIDLLRATTTICQALASGASEVVPFRHIDETLAAADRIGRDQVVLGGERGGRRIVGFDLGNSPAEYTPDAVRGRRVLITTTNGTQALYHARLARRVIVGAIVNLSAVAACVNDEPTLDILCAGTDQQVTREDLLAAGAIVKGVCDSSKSDWQTNDAAQAALRLWDQLRVAAAAGGRSLSDELAAVLRDTPGGRNLIDVGLDQDLSDCARIDRFNIVPELDVPNWRISVPHGGNSPR
jgi:2-phosphosulfolactate phosphatase